jgi:hypothetical protein
VFFNPQLAYTLITLSIPFLTILLISPYSPSLPPLHPTLIPLSRLLLHTLHKFTYAAGIFLPLILILFGVFAYSMNGDIFRGLDVNTWLALPEVGVAPFEARVWVFITMTLLIVFSIILGCARVNLVGGEKEGKRWKGGVKAGDDWEVEYGVLVGRMARRDYDMAVRRYAGMRYTEPEASAGGRDAGGRRVWTLRGLVVPFNILAVPLDTVIILTTESVHLAFLSAREWLEISLTGPMCWAISFIIG